MARVKWGEIVARYDSDHNVSAAEARVLAFATSHARSVPAAAPPAGMIEKYGYHERAGGWFVCGWVRHREPTENVRDVVMQFGADHIRGNALAWYYSRSDLKDSAVGVVLFVRTPVAQSGAPLVGIDLPSDSGTCSIPALAKLELLSGSTLAARLENLAERVHPLAARQSFQRKIAAQPYNGTNTLASLNDCVQMHVDESIPCPPGGIVLKGWLLSNPGVVRSIRLRNGQNVATVDLDKCPKVARPDVIKSVGAAVGVSDPRCGFVAYVPDAITSNAELYLEVEVSDLDVGFCPVPKPRTTGLEAVQRVLNDIDCFSGNLSAVFESGIGQAIAQLNKARLERNCPVVTETYGNTEPSPLCSLIIPLHRRIDFAEYQMALFSELGHCRHEIIYVLDDPQRVPEARRLFASIYERFGLPFRTLYLEQNLGFAPASNIGLREATGEYVCFLNSDVIPGDRDWADRLISRLKANPGLGAIGPLLLYGDGSVQHEGMNFMQVGEFDDWFFCDHPRKGLRRSSAMGLRKCVAITGACLMMERSVANELSGFDENFVVGDFEDSDLCLRLNDRGMSVGVDLDVALVHLERQSQAAPGQRWRQNLTLYNAWVHQKRWAAKIRALADQPPGADTLDTVRSSILDKARPDR